MAFVRVDKSRQGGYAQFQPVVTMGAYLADGKKHASRSIMFRISRPLLDQLGWTFDSSSIDVAISEGTDKDSGYLQVVPVPADLHTRRMTLSQSGKGSHGVAVSMTIESFKHYVLNECPVSAAIVPHMVDGNALIIECPDWLRYNPESVPKPEPKPVAPPVQLHPGRGRRRG
jgi:hypothetical protein